MGDWEYIRVRINVVVPASARGGIALATRRAHSVRDYLVSQQVSPAQLQVRPSVASNKAAEAVVGIEAIESRGRLCVEVASEP